MTQVQLATQLKVTTAIPSRALYDPIIPTSSHWPAVLDILGLEVVIQPKSQ